MTSHPDPMMVERLSAYLDDDVGDRVRAELASHLAGCASCRRTLEELRGLRRAAGALAPRSPERDLWPEIRSALGEQEPGAPRVIPLYAGGAGSPASVTLPRRTLVAASLALALVSSAATWVVGLGFPGVASPTGMETSSPSVATPAGLAPSAVAGPASVIPTSMARDLESLEAVFRDARGRLDPETVRVLDASLRRIEGALADAYRALAEDPSNDFVAQHLRRTYERKLDFLRGVASVVRSSG